MPAVIGQMRIVGRPAFGAAVGRVEVEEGFGGIITAEAVGEVKVFDGDVAQPVGDFVDALARGDDRPSCPPDFGVPKCCCRPPKLADVMNQKRSARRISSSLRRVLTSSQRRREWR